MEWFFSRYKDILFMLQNIITVAVQALILFGLMAVGYGLYRTGKIEHGAVQSMNNMLVWAITPCVIINSFSREFDAQLAGSLAIFAVCAACGILLALAGGFLFFRRQPKEDSAALRLCAAFSNGGYMGLPLTQALFGAEGVMYASIFVVVFNLIIWTAGYAVISGEKLSIKKALLNPGLIGLAIGLPLFILPISTGTIAGTVISSLAAMNTPLAMVVIGCNLVEAKLLTALRDWRVYLATALRLLIMPGVSLIILALLPRFMPPLPCCVLIIELAAPVAALTVPMSSMSGRNSALASKCVAMSTLLSILTLPLLAAFAGAIFGAA